MRLPRIKLLCPHGEGTMAVLADGSVFWRHHKWQGGTRWQPIERPGDGASEDPSFGVTLPTETPAHRRNKLRVSKRVQKKMRE